jgi:hypothetical protein
MHLGDLVLTTTPVGLPRPWSGNTANWRNLALTGRPARLSPRRGEGVASSRPVSNASTTRDSFTNHGRHPVPSMNATAPARFLGEDDEHRHADVIGDEARSAHSRMSVLFVEYGSASEREDSAVNLTRPGTAASTSAQSQLSGYLPFVRANSVASLASQSRNATPPASNGSTGDYHMQQSSYPPLPSLRKLGRVESRSEKRRRHDREFDRRFAWAFQS